MSMNPPDPVTPKRVVGGGAVGGSQLELPTSGGGGLFPPSTVNVSRRADDDEDAKQRHANIECFMMARRLRDVPSYWASGAHGSFTEPYLFPILGEDMKRTVTSVAKALSKDQAVHTDGILSILQFLAPQPSTSSQNKRKRHVQDSGSGPALPAASTTTPLKATTITSPHASPRLTTTAPPAGEKAHLDGTFHLLPSANCTKLFTRMIKGTSNQEFGAEELNRYFGRYGQIEVMKVVPTERIFGDIPPSPGKGGATPLGLDGASAQRGGGSAVKHHLAGHQQHQPSGEEHLYDDFIITVDSAENAKLAITEMDEPEVFFVAFSSPEHDVYEATDLPSLEQFFYNYGVVEASAMSLTRNGAPAVGVIPHLPHQHLALLAEVGADDSSSGFIPDIIVEGLPFWATSEQVAEYLKQHGTVVAVRTSVDDRTGCSQGCCLVQMSTVEEALAASEAFHGKDMLGTGQTLVCGILDRYLNIVSLRTGEVLMSAQPEDEKEKNSEAGGGKAKGGKEDSRKAPPKVLPSLDEDDRLWL